MSTKEPAASDGHFAIGELVAVRADPERRGPVIGVLPLADGTVRYQVFHSSSSTREYSLSQLVAVERPSTDSWAEVLRNGPLLDVTQLQARLVAAQLAHPETDHVYALRAARIRFIPFQFKPLLRLLRSDRPRLLIADDVGVGKTIEAGLILKELSTRQPLDRALVMCPKALTVKWRAEMRRFDEHFRILTAGDLRYCLNEAHLEGEWPEEFSRAIVHYELARMEPYLMGSEVRGRTTHGLLELDPAPRFDIVIADEAHHLRTPGTGSHKLMEYLCDVAETVLMLTATPVQVDSHNLFVLLSLLRPDLFPDKATYDEVVEPNKFITRAIRTLRAGPASGDGWLEQVRVELEHAAGTNWGRTALIRDSAFAGAQSRALTDDLDDAGRVTCIRDLEEAHSLSHVMNRTRRRDIGRFTIRDPQTISIAFSREQQAFYDQVLAFRRQVLLEKHTPQVVNLVLDTLERQAASSITALAEDIESLVAANGFAADRITDDPDYEGVEQLTVKPVAAEVSDLIEAAKKLPEEDPKYDRLLTLIDATLASEGPGKVLVFSYFLHTLDYLKRRLTKAEVRVELITGRTEDHDREALRQRFRLDRSDPDAIDILLSSEVGCEGLDYEFCDRLVNYDIPWNPMRLEQRIGRIDRFGQRSDKVVIFNFVTPGTVEERVFFRCFERLGVFRDTVGDLEEVLGPVVKELNDIALHRSLSPEQADEQARQVADNVLRLAEEQRRLDAESGTLLGLDDTFADEVDNVVDRHRFVDERDIEALVESFLVTHLSGSTLTPNQGGRRTLKLTKPATGELVKQLRGLSRDRATLSLIRALEGGQPAAVTFEQEVAAEDRSIDFVTPVHPLARLATQHYQSLADPVAGTFRLRSSTIASGRYLFACERWETIAVRPEVRLVCLVVDLETGALNEELGVCFWRCLSKAEPVGGSPGPLVHDVISDRLQALTVLSESRRLTALAALSRANDVIVDRRLASLGGSYEIRARRIRDELAAATDSKIVTMKTAELRRVTADFERRSAELERCRNVEILTERVAAGYVEVGPA